MNRQETGLKGKVAEVKAGERTFSVFATVGGADERETLKDMLPTASIQWGGKCDLSEFLPEEFDLAKLNSVPCYLFKQDGRIFKVLS